MLAARFAEAPVRDGVDDMISPLVSEMPHGGFKQSGYGKDLSARGLHADQARHGEDRLTLRQGQARTIPYGAAPTRIAMTASAAERLVEAGDR